MLSPLTDCCSKTFYFSYHCCSLHSNSCSNTTIIVLQHCCHQICITVLAIAQLLLPLLAADYCLFTFHFNCCWIALAWVWMKPDAACCCCGHQGQLIVVFFPNILFSVVIIFSACCFVLMLLPSLYCGLLVVVSTDWLLLLQFSLLLLACLHNTNAVATDAAITISISSLLIHKEFLMLHSMSPCHAYTYAALMLLLAAIPNLLLCLGCLLDIATGGLMFKIHLMPLLAVW